MKNIITSLFILTIVLTSVGCDQKAVQKEKEISQYTLSEVIKHDSADDCWLIIDGKIYDVTSFISSHPGGKAIIEGCGEDATTFFETRPMGSGTPHSDRARMKSEELYIGDLI